jgi:hypothetical protein
LSASHTKKVRARRWLDWQARAVSTTHTTPGAKSSTWWLVPIDSGAASATFTPRG